MEKKYFDEMSIDGCVDIRKNPVSEDEFWQLFIGWIEENNWYFGGGIEGVEESE